MFELVYRGHCAHLTRAVEYAARKWQILLLSFLIEGLIGLSACATSPTSGSAISIPSHQEWVDTGINVAKDEKMDLVAQGHWWDFVIRCTADGYSKFPASFFYAIGESPRETDDGRYFRLMGRIIDPANPPSNNTSDSRLDPNDPDGTFIIGEHAVYTAKRSGRLYVFANDKRGWFFYGNNWGHVWLTATPVPE
jgi:hypothetical protein